MRDRGRWISFAGLRAVHCAHTLAEVPAVFTAVDRAARNGRCTAGYVAYEAASVCDSALVTHAPAGMLAYFAEYDHMTDGILGAGEYQVSDVSPRIRTEDYRAAFAAIREHLAAGNTYQVNYTFPFAGSFVGDARAFFADRVRRFAPPYAAFIDTGDEAIASFSPELFFSWEDGVIISQPMKGTRARGPDDARAQRDLAVSEKDRAENLMIVDMIRNDIGRIAEAGSVTVPELYRIERHPYVWQMTSLVRGRTHACFADIMRAMFPCASVTGAPKARTMKIIRDVEPYPRGIYTGTIGFVTPDRMQFSVAIRTAVIDKAAGTLSYHAGSGIVWDSAVDAEYEECVTKTKALAVKDGPVTLLESFRWDGSGYYLRGRHMERLCASAAYFGIAVDTASINDALDRYARGIDLPSAKVRLMLKHDGTFSIMHEPLVRAGAASVSVVLAREPVDEDDIMLRHKHTERAVYERAKASVIGADDVLLWNMRREVTEASSSNIVYRRGGRYWTPPLSSGLLPGTLRAELLARGLISERLLTVEDLAGVEALFLINSVRKCRRALLMPCKGQLYAGMKVP